MSANDNQIPGGVRSEEHPFQSRGHGVVRLWNLFFLVVLFILFLLLLWKSVSVLLLLFAGILVAIALRFLSDSISRWTHIPPLWSLTILLVVLIGGGTVILVATAPLIGDQMRELATNLQESLRDLDERFLKTETGRYLAGQIEAIEGKELPDLWNRVAGVFTTTFGAVAAFSLTLIVGIFLAYNPGLYVRGFLRLIPLQKRRRAHEILQNLAETLRWWMIGQLISMAVLAVTTWLMLWLLGVPLAFILGLLTGILTFIPYLGPLLALIPILLVAFVENPTLMIYVLAFYLIVQNLEGNVLMPIIFEKTVHLPPVLTIISQILLGAVFGFVGVILATPMMTAGVELVKMIYVEDVLGDSMKKSPLPD